MFTLLQKYRMGWLAPLMISLFAQSAMAAPGSLDTTFGSGGNVITDFPSTDEDASAVAIQTDGKIVVAGMYSTGANFDFAVLRYNPNGELDTTFSTDGKATVDFGGAYDVASDLVIQPDGKILVVGTSTVLGTSTTEETANLALARLTPTGALDTTFDGDGKLTTTLGEGPSYGTSVTLQADNKIVVAGTSMIAGDDEFTVLRYTPTGALDTTFDTDGIVTVSFGSNNSYAKKVLVNPTDQNIILVGDAYSDAKMSTSCAAARITPTGALDSSFGLTGRVLTSFKGGTEALADAKLQADGKLVVMGRSYRGNLTNIALARFNTKGELDTTFSTDGKLTLAIGSGLEYENAVAFQADGKILIGGSKLSGEFRQFALARYTTTGEIDLTFGTAGKTAVSVGGSDSIRALAVQSDGNIVAAGDARRSGGNPRIGLARFSGK